jgi:toluene monooxygenase electron transfer component
MNIQVRDRGATYEFECRPEERLLHSGLQSGLSLPYECASGTCGSCKAKLVSGNIDDHWSSAPGRKYLAGPDEFLLCQCTANTDCVIEVKGVAHAFDGSANTPTNGRGVVANAKILAPHVLSFSVELDRAIDFEAGQFVCLRFPGIPGFRSYSMVNHESGARRLDFVIKEKLGGSLTPWLLDNSIDGFEVDWYGALGSATFHPDLRKNILCIAGGTGIAGMMSILSRAATANHLANFRASIFFGVRTFNDAFYLSELEEVAAAFPDSVDITVALSDEEVLVSHVQRYASLNFQRGLVHEVAGKAMTGRYANIMAYLAGPPPAVDATLRMLLLQAKLPVQSIRFDKFS